MKAVVRINYGCSNIAPNQITKNSILCFPFLGSFANRFSCSSRTHCCKRFSFQLFKLKFLHPLWPRHYFFCSDVLSSKKLQFSLAIQMLYKCHSNSLCLYLQFCCLLSWWRKATSLGWRPLLKLRCELCLWQWSLCHSTLKKSVPAVPLPVAYLRTAELLRLEGTSWSHLIYSPIWNRASFKSDTTSIEFLVFFINRIFSSLALLLIV